MGTASINTRTPRNIREYKYNSKYMLFICAVFCALLLARSFSDIAFYAFVIVSSIVFVLSNISQCISLLFFLLPSATILKSTPDGMSFFTILFFLVILKMIIQHRKIDALLVITLIVFFVYGIFFSEMGELTTIITMIAGVLMIYYIRSDAIYIDVNSSIIAYSFGICFSSILALCKESLPIIKTFVNDSMIKTDGSEYAARFSGLHGNPNYYTLDIIVALSAIIVLMYYKNKTPKILMVCLLALSVFGLMSISKSFLITWLLLMICWFFLSIKKGAGKLFKFISITTIGVMIIYYFAYDSINTYLFRFTTDISGTLDSITTGRLEIWSAYLEKIFNDTNILFFGNGLNTIIEFLGKGPHSTYLDFLFNLGIIGTVILVVLIRIAMGRVRFKGVVWIPVIMLLIRMFAISILTYDNLWFYFAILLMLENDYQKSKLENL